MKILALSDVQGNIAVLEKLRGQERNEFDSVVIAGDIGGEKSDQIFEVLSSFDCPVLYVYGNHECELEYDRPFGSLCTHLHMNMVEVGDMTFTGFSGCPTSWGQNPIAVDLLNKLCQEHKAMFGQHVSPEAEPLWTDYFRKIRPFKAYKRFEEDLKEAIKMALALNKRALFDKIKSSGVDPQRVVIVTHERLFKLDKDLPGIHCHLFGHRDEFKYHERNGTHYVNLHGLDHERAFIPASEAYKAEDQQKKKARTYAVIELDGTDKFQAIRREIQ